MKPYQRFQTIFKEWFEVTSNSIGLNILNKDFKLGIHTGFTVSFIASIFVFCVYTICSTESEMQLKSASCLSLASQVKNLGFFWNGCTWLKIANCSQCDNCWYIPILQGIVKSICILIFRSKILFLVSWALFCWNEK